LFHGKSAILRGEEIEYQAIFEVLVSSFQLVLLELLSDAQHLNLRAPKIWTVSPKVGSVSVSFRAETEAEKK